MLQPLLARGASPFTIMRHPLFRSYGVNLPSSLTWFLSRTLGFSPHLPVSVYGTDTKHSTFRSFSRQRCHSKFIDPKVNYLTPLGLSQSGFADSTSYGLRPTISAVGSPDLLRPFITPARWYWNINQLSIDYASRPRLRIRLTLGGRTCPRKP